MIKENSVLYFAFFNRLPARNLLPLKSPPENVSDLVVFGLVLSTPRERKSDIKGDSRSKMYESR